MKTTQELVIGDARSMSELESDSVELVVTSPPYPMIEMWDELFCELNPAVGDYLDDGDGSAAFDAMHSELDRVWEEVSRVLVDGGIACINIGDATRKVDDSFRVFQNHSSIIDSFEELGFEPLPEILWRKPVNSGAKFMGSGMIPPNAYVTLEHEYILVFRNGKNSRSFEPKADERYESAYFWEERNRWFSDIWEGVRGADQILEADESRDRSAAYPPEIPFRLINMYSTYSDTVLDPFIGTGTTAIAAAAAGRDSIGYEIDAELGQTFEDEMEVAPEYARGRLVDRLRDHIGFVEDRIDEGDAVQYRADEYDIRVMTKQEQPIQFYSIVESTSLESGIGYEFVYEPIESLSDIGIFDTNISQQSPSEMASLSDF